MKTLRMSTEGDVTVITLARPEKRNAISLELMGELMLAMREAEESPAKARLSARVWISKCFRRPPP